MTAEIIQALRSNPREFLKQNFIIINEGLLLDEHDNNTGVSWDENKYVKKQKKISAGKFCFERREDMEKKHISSRVLSLKHIKESETASFNPKDLLNAYWLSFGPNKAYRTVLSGHDAEFMFTANMTGCTFARGTQTTSGDIIVSHSNAINVASDAQKKSRNAGKNLDDATADGVSAAAEEQERMVLAKMLKAGAEQNKIVKLAPSVYAEGTYTNKVAMEAQYGVTYSAFVLGVCKNMTWNFLSQRRFVAFPGQYVIQDVLDI